MSHDREIETYLQGKTDLSQLYADAPQVEPPDHLDAAILAEAHRAVKARPGAKPKRRWMIPLGLVASLFVVVMVGLQLPYMLKEAALPLQKDERIAVAAMEKSTAESASPDERGKIQAMAKPRAGITHREPAPTALQAEAAAKPNAPVPAAPQVPQAVGNVRIGAASVAELPSVAAPAQSPAIAAKRAGLLERAEADKGVAPSKEKKASVQATGEFGDSLEHRAPAAAPMAAPEPARAARSMAQPLNEEAGDTSLRPEDWLNRILRLKQQGKLQEAKKELAAFKKRYPDYRVPETLEFDEAQGQ